ncbi:MAG: hypothetical protein IJE44_01710 [Clostridia bacterium]|nr:hypothetical protein [Clostridia bacterium]
MKKAYFFIDDVIWCLRDLARNKPASLFDVPFFKALKEAHDRYGVKTQLNLFYRTDYAYGYDEFTLAEVPDTYKKEWEEASDWLKLSFHAKQEFPDYPHVNASYEDVKRVFEDTHREVVRFAGEKTFAYGLVPHWLPVSKAGVKALRDCGVKLMNATHGGDTKEFDGDANSLPYGHAFRLLQNRQPETKVFTRTGRDVAIARSICAYNHIPEDHPAASGTDFSLYYDEETDMYFKNFTETVLNLTPYDKIESDIAPLLGNEYIGIADHEEYFFEDYCAYQSDYAEKIYKMGEILKENGYEFFFIEEMIK